MGQRLLCYLVVLENPVFQDPQLFLVTQLDQGLLEDRCFLCHLRLL